MVGECENPFAEDLIADGAGVLDQRMPILAKVSCLVDVLMTGIYELVVKLWELFVLTAGRVNAEVA